MFLAIVARSWVEITPGYVATRRSSPACLPIALTDLVKPWSIAIVTVGTPAFSAATLARELAAVQLPHPAMPEMTTSTPWRRRFSGRSRMTSDSLGP